MARISTYGVDAKPELGDKTIGTDVAPGAKLRTKNYSLGDVATMFSQTNSNGVADQVTYLFQTDLSNGRDAGTISFEAGGGVGTPFSSVTSFMVSKVLIGNKRIDNYLPLFDGKSIILAQLGDLDKYGVYTVDNIVEHPTETDFFIVDVTVANSNGVMAQDATYIFSEFTSAAGASDKNYIHAQTTASSVWTVAHNLNKFPSVSVVISTGQRAFADVIYIDQNNLRIEFSAAESGEAYIN